MLADDVKEQLLRRFSKDRYLAHRHLFAHRRKDASPEFHGDILRLFYSPSRNIALEAFRGGAKSTLIEEYVLMEVLFREVHFPIIIGNNYGMACERLATIKQELTNNDALIDLFGDQRGSTWSEGEIILANGIKIQALGAKQSMRGVKHNNERPDLAVIDDLEDEEMVATEEAIGKTKRWLNGTLRPALNPKTGKMRMLGTPLHPKCLIEQMMDNKEWETRRFPLVYLNEQGVETSAWEDRFPMEYVEKLRQSYAESGNSIEFEQEYMCRSEDVANKPFQERMIKVEVSPAIWMPTQVMVDPARTTGPKSARTGYAAWAWMGPKLYVREGYGAYHKPDEIINEMFKLDEEFRPVHIGVEADGLEEFIMQPLRAEQLRRGIVLPIVKMRAPHDKIRFITGLQPFYTAGEVIHTKPLPHLTDELKRFPAGLKDVPNALAYSLKMRGGRPVYTEFTSANVVQGLVPDKRRPLWLVMSARPALSTAAVVQIIDGAVHIFADYIRDAPPIDCLQEIIREASMDFGTLKLIAPLEQFDKYNNNGILAVCTRLRMQAQQAGPAGMSQGALAKWLQQTARGEPALMVEDMARWVINGMALGYRRTIDATGKLSDQPEDNTYRVLMEGIESFMSWSEGFIGQTGDDSQRNYAYTDDGRRYISSLPKR